MDLVHVVVTSWVQSDVPSQAASIQASVRGDEGQHLVQLALTWGSGSFHSDLKSRGVWALEDGQAAREGLVSLVESPPERRSLSEVEGEGEWLEASKEGGRLAAIFSARKEDVVGRAVVKVAIWWDKDGLVVLVVVAEVHNVWAALINAVKERNNGSTLTCRSLRLAEVVVAIKVGDGVVCKGALTSLDFVDALLLALSAANSMINPAANASNASFGVACHILDLAVSSRASSSVVKAFDNQIVLLKLKTAVALLRARLLVFPDTVAILREGSRSRDQRTSAGAKVGSVSSTVTVDLGQPNWHLVKVLGSPLVEGDGVVTAISVVGDNVVGDDVPAKVLSVGRDLEEV